MTNQARSARAVAKQTKQINPATLYPYVLLFALMDVYLTSRILAIGGVEVNGFANHILGLAGVLGLLTLKLTSVLIVFFACDYIASRGDRRAVRLAQAGIALNVFPAVIGATQLAIVFAQFL